MAAANTVGDDTLVNVEQVQFINRLVALDDPVLLQPAQHVSTEGDDTAVFRGNRADHKLSYDITGFWESRLVSDLLTGRDGSDRLITNETLRFADSEVSVKSLLAQVPPAPLPQPNPSTEDVVWYVQALGSTSRFGGSPCAARP